MQNWNNLASDLSDRKQWLHQLTLLLSKTDFFSFIVFVSIQASSFLVFPIGYPYSDSVPAASLLWLPYVKLSIDSLLSMHSLFVESPISTQPSLCKYPHKQGIRSEAVSAHCSNRSYRPYSQCNCWMVANQQNPRAGLWREMQSRCTNASVGALKYKDVVL